jgi:chromosome partitioning protein
MAMQKISVLHGSLSDIGLVELLQVISAGRQYMAVQLEEAEGRVLGALLLKSGMLLDARTRSEQGKNAFFFLLGDPHAESFTVFRMQGDWGGARPLGRLDTLVLESAGYGPVPDASGWADAVAAGPARAEQPAKPSEPRGRILAVASPKGGVGKTTLSLNLGVALAERGLSVLLVDADPMGGLGDSLALRVRQAAGVYEVLRGRLPLSGCLIRTRVQGLRIVPAGQWPADDGESWRFAPAAWASLFDQAARAAELVLVDTAAGLQAVTTAVLRQCDDVLGVLQAEAVGARSFQSLVRFLEQFDGQGRPRLGGIVVNMFQHQPGGTQAVVHDALKGLPAGIVMQPVIPRDPVLLEANSYGVPVAFLDRKAPPTLHGVFDTLAADLSARLGVARAPQRSVVPFLD